jgi:hypothetical protein
VFSYTAVVLLPCAPPWYNNNTQLYVGNNGKALDVNRIKVLFQSFPSSMLAMAIRGFGNAAKMDLPCKAAAHIMGSKIFGANMIADSCWYIIGLHHKEKANKVIKQGWLISLAAKSIAFFWPVQKQPTKEQKYTIEQVGI